MNWKSRTLFRRYILIRERRREHIDVYSELIFIFDYSCEMGEHDIETSNDLGINQRLRTLKEIKTMWHSYNTKQRNFQTFQLIKLVSHPRLFAFSNAHLVFVHLKNAVCWNVTTSSLIEL